jgi:hypothetical protein
MDVVITVGKEWKEAVIVMSFDYTLRASPSHKALKYMSIEIIRRWNTNAVEI